MKPRHIAAKLIAWFLLISLVPLAVIGALDYFIEEANLRAEVTSRLLAITEERARAIDTYIVERERDVTTLSRTPGIIEAMQRLDRAFEAGGLDSPEYQSADKQFRPFLSHYRDTVGCEDLFLISAQGDALFSVNQGEDLGSNYKNGPYKDSELAKAFDRANTILETDISDFSYYQATNAPAAFIAAPVLSKGVVLGVVALQLSNDEVYELVRDYTGLGETGETIIGSRVEDEAVFLTPVRHDPYAAFRRRIAMGSELALPLQQALLGTKDNGIAIDYRDEQVLAVWRYLPSSRWGMVVKMDTAEAFAPITHLRNRSLVIGSVATVVVVLAALVVSRTLSKPITSLTDSARSLAGGDLSTRADVSTNDEIGELASEFNTMAQQIQVRTRELRQLTETLEQRVADRTRELAKSNEALEQSNVELQQFAYIASHDLQSPLRAVAGFAHFLQQDYQGQLDEKADEHIDRIIEGCKRMQTMISDLLAYSRVDSRLRPFQPTDLGKVFDDAVALLRAEIEDVGGEVTRGELPTVAGDRSQLAQLLQNLLANGLKYHSNDPPRVHVSAEQNGRGWTIAVRDNGIGIAPKYHERIFEIFRRLHAQDKYPGTGIGLAVCRRIVHRHHGEIWVTSEEGKGSTFYFSVLSTEKERHFLLNW